MSSDALIEAYKAKIAELQLGLKQANELVIRLKCEHLDAPQRVELFEKITTHLIEQDDSKASHLSVLLRVMLLQLNQMAQQTADQVVKQGLIKIIESINIVLER